MASPYAILELSAYKELYLAGERDTCIFQRAPTKTFRANFNTNVFQRCDTQKQGFGPRSWELVSVHRCNPERMVRQLKYSISALSLFPRSE
jgi:hypothetical protein